MTITRYYTGDHMPSPATLIIPDWDMRRKFTASVGAGIDMCWTCGACDNECPVRIATNRLHPQQTVRMVTYGMIDELLSMPDYWYCLSCRRCLRGCPNRVKPYALHCELQIEALARGVLSQDFITAYRKLFSQFQRVRWRAAALCFREEPGVILDSTWYSWLRTPLRKAIWHDIKIEKCGRHSVKPKGLSDAKSQLCFTCNECSGCCPIVCDADVFDPMRIIRMVNLGLLDNLLHSPAIWLCMNCRQCSETCSQTVSVCSVIQQLQHLAIDKGIVDPSLPTRLLKADRMIYPKFLDEIDTLLGLYKVTL